LEIPFWLDDEFLYHLNYGLASSEEVRKLKTQNGKRTMFPFYPRNVITNERANITLLDRPLAAKLENALFGKPSL
jgi:hypothetical protein